jgi:hypothetical protein
LSPLHEFGVNTFSELIQLDSISPSISFEKKNVLQVLLLSILGLWSVISLLRIIQFTLSTEGANDLYVYWYAGHFVREAQDPYRAFLTGQAPTLPIHYLDKTVTDLQEVIVPGWVPAPALTFPLIAVLSLFAFLSWSSVKLVWLGFNLFFILIIPPLALRIFGSKERWGAWTVVAFTMVFIGLTSTRYAASSGQMTFLVILLSLGSIHLSRSHPLLAGLLLGFALSKYSLSIGFFLYLLLFERNYRTILAAISVQATGLLVLSTMSGTPMLSVVLENIFMLIQHSKLEGIHLASLFPQKPWDVQIAIILSIAVAIPLILWYRRKKKDILVGRLSTFHRQHLLASLALWSLLVGYHRAYDVVIYILFLSLGLSMYRYPESWDLSQRSRNILLVFIGLSTIVFMLPAGSLIRGLLPSYIGNTWTLLSVRTTTLMLLAALSITIFLLFRYRGRYNMDRLPGERKFNANI